MARYARVENGVAVELIDTGDYAIAQLFAPYGEVYEVRLITDRDTRQSKGFGFVELASDEAARRAIADLNGMQAGDRTLTVNEARPQAERTPRRDYR